MVYTPEILKTLWILACLEQKPQTNVLRSEMLRRLPKISIKLKIK